MTTEIGERTHDNLLAGDFPLVTLPITVVSGENVSRGAVMGKITASGKYKLCTVDSSDGSEVAELVMSMDVDASAADAPGIGYLTGDFNENALTFGSVDTYADHASEMRLRSLFVHNPVTVNGTIS